MEKLMVKKRSKKIKGKRGQVVIKYRSSEDYLDHLSAELRRQHLTK